MPFLQNQTVLEYQRLVSLVQDVPQVDFSLYQISVILPEIEVHSRVTFPQHDLQNLKNHFSIMYFEL